MVKLEDTEVQPSFPPPSFTPPHSPLTPPCRTLVQCLCRGSYLYSRLEMESSLLSLLKLPPATKTNPPRTATQWWLCRTGSSVSATQLPVSASRRPT